MTEYLKAPLSPFRWTWRTILTQSVPSTMHEGPLGALAELARLEGRARDGFVFREMRVRLQLGLQEVADGWGVPAVEVGELERGLRRFPETDDLYAASQQFWLWHVERRGQRLASSTGGRVMIALGWLLRATHAARGLCRRDRIGRVR